MGEPGYISKPPSEAMGGTRFGRGRAYGTPISEIGETIGFEVPVGPSYISGPGAFEIDYEGAPKDPEPEIGPPVTRWGIAGVALAPLSIVPFFGIPFALISLVFGGLGMQEIVAKGRRGVPLVLFSLIVSSLGLFGFLSLLFASNAGAFVRLFPAPIPYNPETTHLPWTIVFILLAVIIPAVIFHEVAHGLVALWCGDPTARDNGRLTLNPLAHVHPFGTIFLPVLMGLLVRFPIAFALPVPIDQRRLSNPRRDQILVALAGPATNILLAVAATGLCLVFSSFLVIRYPGESLLDLFNPDLIWPQFSRVSSFELGILMYLRVTIFLNLLFGMINLVPIPPLDGSWIFENLLPRTLQERYAQMRQYTLVMFIGFVSLLILVPVLLFLPYFLWWLGFVRLPLQILL